MGIVPLYGHDRLRSQLLARLRDGAFPSSLLLHGPGGVGKQRLALWLGQALLCNEPDPPGGKCEHCRYSARLTHPDILWIFPRPRPKDTSDPADFAEDLADATAERAEADGLYARPSGNEGIFVPMVLHAVRRVSLAPALARRKVIVVGDAERMVPQESSPEAANAFLKLLEEPPDDTYLILTSSEPASLLPTIRSRVIAVRVSRMDDAAVRQFLADPAVGTALGKKKRDTDSLVAEAAGAPGRLFGGEASAAAMSAARRMLDAALANEAAARHELALSQAISGARGAFRDVLDSLTIVLAERTRNAVHGGDTRGARAGARAADAVETAKERAAGNLNPQLVTSRLLRDLHTLLG